jgi:hypothetical protein
VDVRKADREGAFKIYHLLCCALKKCLIYLSYEDYGTVVNQTGRTLSAVDEKCLKWQMEELEVMIKGYDEELRLG